MEAKTPPILWKPTETFKQQSNLHRYMAWLRNEYGRDFTGYESLWQWSVEQTAAFWESILQYFDVRLHSPYERVIEGEKMPFYHWFKGASLNYAEHLFRHAHDEQPAIVFGSERHEPLEISWAELRSQVAMVQQYLRELGLKPGDRVAAFMPNIPEATIAFIAACSMGVVWSSCSPDFGTSSVLDRFRQIEPRVLFAVDGYTYNGKAYDKREEVATLKKEMPSVEKVVLVPFLNPQADISGIPDAILWNQLYCGEASELRFEAVPFEHPIWVLYSSGTTGLPKAITHSHGGVLLEHLKYLAFHNDVHPGERFFWYSTTGWMMWNFVQAALLVGATIVLYEGSPAYPDLHALWAFAERTKINHFGTSAPFIVACMKRQLSPKKQFDLRALRSISSTGAPLPPEGFDWVYEQVKSDVWLCSMSGGTDVCTAFVGGNPLLPLYEGEIQCRALGAAVEAWDETGRPLVNEVGEMVITRPMPSMPICFWNDPGHKRYLASYFEKYPGVWRHGDWIKITDRGSLIIYGRSDATLNRQGVRIGTAEIYRAVDKVPGIEDSLIVNLELPDGSHYMPLFVKTETGVTLDETLKTRIRQQLRADYSPRHVPDEIIPVPHIPYTISGKKMEAPVKKILLGMDSGKAVSKDSMKNPEALDFFIRFRSEKLHG